MLGKDVPVNIIITANFAHFSKRSAARLATKKRGLNLLKLLLLLESSQHASN